MEFETRVHKLHYTSSSNINKKYSIIHFLSCSLKIQITTPSSGSASEMFGTVGVATGQYCSNVKKYAYNASAYNCTTTRPLSETTWCNFVIVEIFNMAAKMAAKIRKTYTGILNSVAWSYNLHKDLTLIAYNINTI